MITNEEYIVCFRCFTTDCLTGNEIAENVSVLKAGQMEECRCLDASTR